MDEELKKNPKSKKTNKPKKIEVKNSNDTIRGFKMAEVICLMLFCFAIGALNGYIHTYSSLKNNPKDKELAEIIDIYNQIIKNYYGEVEKEDLVAGAIKGMLGILDDPYTTYYTKSEADLMNERLIGEYVGIGAEVTMVGNDLTIIKPMDNSPSQKAGLKNGDIIRKIGDKDVASLSMDECTKLIKGKEGTKVNISIERDGVLEKYTLTRSSIDVLSVSSEVITKDDKKIGYIYIEVFGKKTKEQFEKQLKALEKENIDSLIIDVRDNSGGYLGTVVDMISLFTEKNKIIYQIEDKKTVRAVKDETKEKRNYKIVVLTNQTSASASEMMAISLKEAYGATIIGNTTYGKGTVQYTDEFTSGNVLKITSQKWLSPNGNWIDKIGVTPDIEVSLDENYYRNPTSENDNQRNRAVEFLIK